MFNYIQELGFSMLYIIVFLLAFPPAVIIVLLCNIGVILRGIYADVIQFPFNGWITRALT